MQLGRTGKFTLTTTTIIIIGLLVFAGYLFWKSNHFTLTISTNTTNPDLTTNPAPGSHSYSAGTIVTVRAIDESQTLMIYWVLDSITHYGNTIDVQMNGNHTLTCYFEGLGAG